MPAEQPNQSANTHVDPEYSRSMDAALEKWGIDPGSKEYLPNTEMDRLALIIQAARGEIEESAAVKAAIQQARENIKEGRTAPYPNNTSMEDVVLTIHLQALPPDHEARMALDKLVECNLKFAAERALASMGILASDDEIKHKELRERLSAFADITRLRSGRAVLADRIQAANLGLIEAAWKYEPGTVDKHDKPIRFLNNANWRINARLYNHAAKNEGPLISLSRAQVDTARKRKQNWDSLKPGQQEEIRNLEALRDPLNIDRVPENKFIVPEDTALEKMIVVLLGDRIKEVLGTLDEREARSITLYFGLEDDAPKILREVGQEFGIGGEGARRIVNIALSRLRHPARSNLLRPFYRPDGVDVSGQQAMVQEEIWHERARDRWRVYPGERWDQPVKLTSELLAKRDEKITKTLAGIILERTASAFRDPVDQRARMLYPTALLDRIRIALGSDLEAHHVARVWHDWLETIVVQSRTKTIPPGTFSLDRVSQLFSRLLSETMKSNDEVEITIPTWLDGQLNHLGAWLTAGHLIINGNAGNHAGRHMAGVAELTINGNAGSHVGFDSHGHAQIHVTGNTADFAGCQMRGSASINVDGSVGKYCGYGLRSQEASIKIAGDSGVHTGYKARYGTIHVQGNVAGIDFTRHSRVEIIAGRVRFSDISLRQAELD